MTKVFKLVLNITSSGTLLVFNLNFTDVIFLYYIIVDIIELLVDVIGI